VRELDGFSARHMEEGAPWVDGDDRLVIVQRAQPACGVVVAGDEEDGHGGI